MFRYFVYQINLLLFFMETFYESYSLAFGTHDNRICISFILQEPYSFQYVSISNSSCDKNNIVALCQIIHLQQSFFIDAHLLSSFFFFIVPKLQSSLEISAQTFQSSCCYDSFWSSSHAQQNVYA